MVFAGRSSGLCLAGLVVAEMYLSELDSFKRLPDIYSFYLVPSWRGRVYESRSIVASFAAYATKLVVA
jgi:hypothetical protein